MNMENKTEYKCSEPKCKYVSDEAGTCCGVKLVKVEDKKVCESKGGCPCC